MTTLTRHPACWRQYSYESRPTEAMRRRAQADLERLAAEHDGLGILAVTAETHTIDGYAIPVYAHIFKTEVIIPTDQPTPPGRSITRGDTP